MNLLLFLDDWFLDSRIDIVRRYPAARCTRIIEGPEGVLRGPSWNVARGAYQAVVKEDENLVMMESADGETWEKGPRPELRVEGQVPEECEVDPAVAVSSCPFDRKSAIFEDQHDPDPARRFKVLLLPYTGDKSGIGVVACSPDGVVWTMNPEHQWYSRPDGPDTTNNMFYNPLRKVWQVVTRRYNTDRRICIAESPDLRRWTDPEIVLHPDALDPPLMQFYGMAAASYEDEYFIGAVQCYHCPSEERPEHHNQGPHNSWSKWCGSVDGQLAYSYDGRHWWRSDRSVLLPRGEPGSMTSGVVYPFLIRVGEEKVLFDAVAGPGDHGRGELYGEALAVYELRRDGFAYLEPIGGWGQFATRCFAPTGKDVHINYQAPVGQVLVQVSDVERKPIDGYAFADCVPLEGDEIHGAVRWKSGKDLSAFHGKRIRLEFRMVVARIYAVRVPCEWWYTNTWSSKKPQPYII